MEILQGRKKTRLKNGSWKLYHLSWCAWWWACYSAGSHDLLAVKQVNVNFVTQYSPGVLFTWCSPWNRTEVWPKGLRFSPVVLSNQTIIKFKFNLGGPPHTCPERKPSPLQGFFPRSKIESALLEGTDRKGKFKGIISFFLWKKKSLQQGKLTSVTSPCVFHNNHDWRLSLDPKGLIIFMHYESHSLQSPVKVLEKSASFEKSIVEDSRHSRDFWQALERISPIMTSVLWAH